MKPSRRFRLQLAGACLLGLVLQALFRWLEWGADPLARVPLDDAGVYWDWAGAIAGGRLVGDEPFLSAPLYPYFLGLLRALGFGLPGVYAVQAMLQAATAWLLGGVARRHFLGPATTEAGPGPPAPGSPRAAEAAAVVAALVFLLLSDPAYAVGRLLNSSLQLLLVVGLWRLMQLARDRDRPLRDAALGAVAGLNVLANPAMLLALPLLVIWRLRDGRRTAPPRALMLLAPALLVIAPATIHNSLACGEPILVSAQAGVTFVHGNAPGADGGYHPIPGVSSGRLKQNRDAYRMAAKATGEESWRGTSRYFRQRGSDWIFEHPGTAAALVLRKIGLYFGAHATGDVAVPYLERQAGLRPWNGAVPAPLVLVPAALLLAAALLRRRAGFEETLLFLLPLLVVCLFFYSPRYRMPALPVAVVVAIGGLALRQRLAVLGAAGGVLALFLGAALEPGEDVLRPAFEHKLGEAYEREGDFEAAEARYRQAMELGFADAAASLGHVQRLLGREQDGLATLREAAAARPDSPYARRSLGVALAENGLYQPAEAEFRAAIALDPGDWEALTGLGNVLLESGRIPQAVESHRAALAARPGHAPAWFNLGQLYLRTGEDALAVEAFETALEHDSSLLWARLALVPLYSGSDVEGLRSAGKANEHARRAADQIGQEERPAPETVAEMFQTLARARAAAEDFGEAVRYQEEAVRVALEAGAPAAVLAGMEGRAEAYRAGRAVGPKD